MTAELLLGLGTGILFGALLQKGAISRFERQIGFLLFRDFTLLRFMLSAIATGMVGIALFSELGFLGLSHRAMNVGGVAMGALIVGAGWALTGLAPGSAFAAIGEGRLHAIFIVAGMLAGALCYAYAYPFLRQSVLAWNDLGPIGIAQATGIPAKFVAALTVVGILALLRRMDRGDAAL